MARTRKIRAPSVEAGAPPKGFKRAEARKDERADGGKGTVLGNSDMGTKESVVRERGAIGSLVNRTNSQKVWVRPHHLLDFGGGFSRR